MSGFYSVQPLLYLRSATLTSSVYPLLNFTVA
jgi:hypothetical protein